MEIQETIFNQAIEWLIREHRENVLVVQSPYHYHCLINKQKELFHQLRSELEEQEYIFSSVTQCRIPKPNGGWRNVGLLSLKDRLLLAYFTVEHFSSLYKQIKRYQGLIDYNRPITINDPSYLFTESFYPSFKAFQYRQRSAFQRHQLIAIADIHSFTGTIDPYILIETHLAENINDEWKTILSDLFQNFNNHGFPGIPMGSFVSEFFQKIYLSDIDQKLIDVFGEYNYFRYNDDICLTARRTLQAGRKLGQLRAILKQTNQKGMELNEKKTTIKKPIRGQYQTALEKSLIELSKLGHDDITIDDLKQKDKLVNIYHDIVLPALQNNQMEQVTSLHQYIVKKLAKENHSISADILRQYQSFYPHGFLDIALYMKLSNTLLDHPDLIHQILPSEEQDVEPHDAYRLFNTATQNWIHLPPTELEKLSNPWRQNDFDDKDYRSIFCQDVEKLITAIRKHKPSDINPANYRI